MPEGDTLARIAVALRPYLAGRVVTAARARLPGPQVSRIVGQKIDAVDAAGKNLLIKFDGGLELRTHLGLHGSWHRYRPGETWRRPPSRAALVIEVPGRRGGVLRRPGRRAVRAPGGGRPPDDLDARTGPARRRLRPGRGRPPPPGQVARRDRDRRGDPRPAGRRRRRQRLQERGPVHRAGRPVREGRQARHRDARARPRRRRASCSRRTPDPTRRRAGRRPSIRRPARSWPRHGCGSTTAPVGRATAAARSSAPTRRAPSCPASPTGARASSARRPRRTRRRPRTTARRRSPRRRGRAGPRPRPRPRRGGAPRRRPSGDGLPRSANVNPEPATRSRTEDDTSTSPAPAAAATRAPTWTAMPSDVADRQLLDLAGVDAGPDLEARGPAPRPRSTSRPGSRGPARRTPRGTRRRPCRSRGRDSGPAPPGPSA